MYIMACVKYICIYIYPAIPPAFIKPLIKTLFTVGFKNTSWTVRLKVDNVKYKCKPPPRRFQDTYTLTT